MRPSPYATVKMLKRKRTRQAAFVLTLFASFGLWLGAAIGGRPVPHESEPQESTLDARAERAERMLHYMLLIEAAELGR